MAYKFKLVHGSVVRTISEHEAKYRVEKQGVAITGMPAGDDCEHCVEEALHVHADGALEDALALSVPPPLPPADEDDGKEAELQSTEGGPAATAPEGLPILTGERLPADVEPSAPAAQTEAPAEAAAASAAPTTPASSTSSTGPSSSGRQGRRGR